MRRVLSVFLQLAFAGMTLPARAEELDDVIKKQIEETKTECLADPEKYLAVIANPQMRADVEGRRYPAFCTCFANTFVRLMDDWTLAGGRTVKNDPDYTKKLKSMTFEDLTLVTYRRCVKLVQDKIP